MCACVVRLSQIFNVNLLTIKDGKHSFLLYHLQKNCNPICYLSRRLESHNQIPMKNCSALHYYKINLTKSETKIYEIISGKITSTCSHLSFICKFK